MEQEPTSSPTPHETPKHSTPWGVFIGLILILAIIVSGAYHAITERLAPPQMNQVK